MIERIKAFFTEVTAELKKVTWPQRKEVQNTTIVVIVSVFFFGFYLYAVDVVFAQVIQLIQRRVY